MDEQLKHMPQMLTGKKLDEALKVLPYYNENIKAGSIAERLVCLQDIYKIFIPSQMSKEIYSKMYLALLRSLQKKQSIMAIRQYCENSKRIRNQSYESIIGGSDCFSVIGISGIGKSSAVTRAIRLLSDSPILQIGNMHILPCLQVQAPADSSVKGLLLEILRKADEILGTHYHEYAIRSHATTDMLIGSVSQVTLNHVGLLIIDEIQNVVNSKNGKTIVGTLTQLINNSGLSVCMVGTPESSIFFDSAMMLARRSLGLNYSAMNYNDEFRNFCKTLLGYCYVKENIKADEELLLWLYNHSKGNVSIIANLIHDAQEIAILDGIEKLDVSTLSIAYEKRLSMLHKYISPETKKATPIKKQECIFTNLKEDTETDFQSIFEISRKAKQSQSNIISELKNNDVKILEVNV